MMPKTKSVIYEPNKNGCNNCGCKRQKRKENSNTKRCVNCSSFV